MKVYLEKGHGMSASLRVNPYKIQHLSTIDRAVPEVIRANSHVLRILGEGDESVDINGSLPELKELVKLLAEALEGGTNEL